MRTPTSAVHGAPSDDTLPFLDKLGTAVLEGAAISAGDAARLTELNGPDVYHLLAWANRIREA